ncbi:hypothetical protein HanIR_Chr09g0419911 [Helianthus annuus]|nr:hypothetical protein HanIR_Chr09g0419911 [Helianthus annuus]
MCALLVLQIHHKVLQEKEVGERKRSEAGRRQRRRERRRSWTPPDELMLCPT